MPKCINDPSKYYKGTEPSPKGYGWCAHSENNGSEKEGKDKNIWKITIDKRGIKRWTKKKNKVNNTSIYPTVNVNIELVYDNNYPDDFSPPLEFNDIDKIINKKICKYVDSDIGIYDIILNFVGVKDINEIKKFIKKLNKKGKLTYPNKIIKKIKKIQFRNELSNNKFINVII